MPTASCWDGHIPQLALASPDGWGNSRRSHFFFFSFILDSSNFDEQELRRFEGGIRSPGFIGRKPGTSPPGPLLGDIL